MLMYFNIFFVFVVLKGVASKNFITSLDISNFDAGYFKLQKVELDNVYYKHFIPGKQFFVKSVNESGSKIWESDGMATCVHCILAMNQGKPYLLYVKADYGYTDRHFYHLKKDGSWKSIDIYEYANALTELKKSVRIEKLFSMNVSNSFSYDLVTVDYASAMKPFTYFTPNVGFMANAVVYNNTKLWSAENKGDRCVAAWAYIRAASYYMIRLLVTKANEESELLTFFFFKNKWELVHTLHHEHDSKEHVRIPDHFLYPNYTFNLMPTDKVEDLPDHVLYEAFAEGKALPKIPETAQNKEYLEGKYYELPPTKTSVDNTDNNNNNTNNNTSSDNNTKTNEESNDNNPKSDESKNYQPSVKVIRKKDCLELDVTKRSNNHQYENLAVFDKYLNVVSYNPPPGKYFDLVVDGNLPLFVGHHLNNVCQSVNFYLKNREFYLVELVVRFENKDLTRHFKKENSRWVYLESSQFLESLDELRGSKN